MDIVEYNPANSIRHPWELVRLKVILHFIRKYNTTQGKLLILDIGCGDCFVALSLLDKQIPATVIGIDPAYTAEDISKKREAINHPDLHLFRNLEDAAHLLNRPVDLVLLLDVIEHIPDDQSFLTTLVTRDFIDSKTKFLISVPAYQSLFTSHDEFLIHYRRYTNRSLKRIVTGANLQPVETGYFFFILLPIRILQKWKEKLFGKPRKNVGLGGWKHGKFLTGMVKQLLLLDFAITRFFKKIGINLPGLSNYCVCKKPVS